MHAFRALARPHGNRIDHRDAAQINDSGLRTREPAVYPGGVARIALARHQTELRGSVNTRSGEPRMRAQQAARRKPTFTRTRSGANGSVEAAARFQKHLAAGHPLAASFVILDLRPPKRSLGERSVHARRKLGLLRLERTLAQHCRRGKLPSDHDVGTRARGH